MTTGQIYWGAVPFVCIQVIMVGLTIAFPQMVMHYKGTVVDPGDDRDQVPEMPGLRRSAHRRRMAARRRPRLHRTCRSRRFRRNAACQAGTAGNRSVAAAEFQLSRRPTDMQAVPPE